MATGLALHTWGWFLARGILLILLGLFAFVAPDFALFVFAVVFAAYSFFDGVLSLIGGIRAARHDGKHWGSMIVSGLAGIAVGVLFVAFPLVSTLAYATVIIWLVALWAVVTGALEVSAAIRLRREIEGEWLLFFSGALSILLGGALLWLHYTRPVATLLSVAWLIAIYAVVSGVTLVILAVRLRRRAAS